MKTLVLFISFAFLAIVLGFGTGCATATRGTHRELRAYSNIPDTEFTLIRESGKGLTTKVGLERTFDVTSYSRSPLVITAKTPCGQKETTTIEWTAKGWVPMAIGGAGFGALLGVGGLVSVGTDWWTGAHCDPRTNEVVFRFDPNKEKTRNAPPIVATAPQAQFIPATASNPPITVLYQVVPVVSAPATVVSAPVPTTPPAPTQPAPAPKKQKPAKWLAPAITITP